MRIKKSRSKIEAAFNVSRQTIYAAIFIF